MRPSKKALKQKITKKMSVKDKKKTNETSHIDGILE